MSAVEEYRKERLRRGPDVDGLTADAALAEETARAERAAAALEEAVSHLGRLYGLIHSYSGEWNPYTDETIEDILARHDAEVKR